jgi:surface antigen
MRYLLHKFSRSRKPLQTALVCLALLALRVPEASAVLPWGTPVGEWRLASTGEPIVAYSNGQWEWYPDRLTGHGKAWQCVEFVNRFYAQVYGLAIEGGDAKHYFRRAKRKGLIAFENGGPVPPRPGDILCSSGPPYGHVAIVKSVGEGEVRLIQQNWFNDGRDADMVLKLTVKDGLYHVSGFGPKHPLEGWLRPPEGVEPAPMLPAPLPGVGEHKLVPAKAEEPLPPAPTAAVPAVSEESSQLAASQK